MPKTVTIAEFAPQDATVLHMYLRTRGERQLIRTNAQAQGPTLERLRKQGNAECDECGAVYPRNRLTQYDSGKPAPGVKRFKAVICDHCIGKYRPLVPSR